MRKATWKLKAAAVTICLSLLAAAIWASMTWLASKPFFDPYVAVVLARKQIDFAIPAEFQIGFDRGQLNKANFFETKNKRRVRIRPMEDFGSIIEAERIANELLNDPNCILVIGNSNSTVTSATLDVFLKSNDPPSYIWPIATATKLIDKARTAGDRAVLRMVPDNASQAIQIQRLVGRLVSVPRVAIYGDEENPLYSDDLMRDIASKVREKGGSVIVEEMIGPNNSIYNSFTIWQKASRPDVIIYVGVAHHGLLLIDQLKALNIRAPIIFTDGSMVGALIQNIKRIPNRAFILSPVGLKGEPNKFPTYEPIGEDAYELTRQLIGECVGDCSRDNMRTAIEGVKGKNSLANGKAGEYQFNADGNNAGMQYKVYEISRGSISLYNHY
jgi:ABC-type branched-subunit amino acid transport system substrate-binding protein